MSESSPFAAKPEGGSDAPIPKGFDKDVDEITPEGTQSTLHQPKTYESYENRKSCPHDGAFTVSKVNIRSGLIDESCNKCGHGRIRKMTDDEQETYQSND